VGRHARRENLLFVTRSVSEAKDLEIPDIRRAKPFAAVRLTLRVTRKTCSEQAQRYRAEGSEISGL